METKASYLLIGGFVLAVIAGIFVFIIWLAKVEIDREFAYYHIDFEGSVAGLTTGSDALYNGIPVGSVTLIELHPDDPSRVRVKIEVARMTPISQDSVASLEIKGITGISQVQITGGSLDSPPIEVGPDQELPVIASKPSPFQELFAGAPEAINRFIVLMDRAARLLDADNRRAVAENVRTVTATFATREDKIGQLIDDLEASSGDMREAAASVNRIATRADGLIDSVDETLAVARGSMAGVDELLDSDIRLLVADARKTAQSLDQAGVQFAELVAENRGPINEFSSEGLFELARLITEMRDLTENLTRLAAQIESDPARFLFGDAQQGFEAR